MRPFLPRPGDPSLPGGLNRISIQGRQYDYSRPGADYDAYENLLKSRVARQGKRVPGTQPLWAASLLYNSGELMSTEKLSWERKLGIEKQEIGAKLHCRHMHQAKRIRHLVGIGGLVR